MEHPIFYYKLFVLDLTQIQYVSIFLQKKKSIGTPMSYAGWDIYVKKIILLALFSMSLLSSILMSLAVAFNSRPCWYLDHLEFGNLSN